MADKYADQDSMDLALSDIADNGNQFHLVSQAPAVYADVATYSLGHVALTLGVGNGVYALAAGVVSGRRLTVVQQTVPGEVEGVATHGVIIDTVNAAIKTVTTAPNYNMQVGVNQTVPAFDAWEIEDPT
jgi:hypothetical protein